MHPSFGIVIIGRNEGERLKNSVRSVLESGGAIVYVDSGSDDGSVEFVRDLQLHVVELDTSIPFSAGRARNEGMQLLLHQHPDLTYIQFVDGDCEVNVDWLQQAIQRLEQDEQLAIVCGRRKERYPEHSIYNQLCDMEWNTPVGPAQSCGGDFMARVSALTQVSGFNPSVIAGEEPDLCYRLRALNWRIERMDADMTLHDAKILRFSQWWKRTLRSGHAYAHNMVLHWGDAERFNVRNVVSITLWGGLMPLLALMSVVFGWLLMLLIVLALYGVMVAKITRYMERGRGFGLKASRMYGAFTMLGKIPQLIGVIQFFIKFVSAKDLEIIEYKN